MQYKYEYPYQQSNCVYNSSYHQKALKVQAQYVLDISLDFEQGQQSKHPTLKSSSLNNWEKSAFRFLKDLHKLSDFKLSNLAAAEQGFLHEWNTRLYQKAGWSVYWKQNNSRITGLTFFIIGPILWRINVDFINISTYLTFTKQLFKIGKNLICCTISQSNGIWLKHWSHTWFVIAKCTLQKK